MTRLFSAIRPPETALAEVTATLAAAPRPDGVRWPPGERWHVTLGFFGDDDDQPHRTAWLRRRVTGRAAPRLRLAGAGTFEGVLWIGVATPDEPVLAGLADAAGAGRRFTPHLTVARWRPGALDQRERAALENAVAGHAGTEFTPGDVLLVRSEPGPGGPRYTTVDRVPLGE